MIKDKSFSIKYTLVLLMILIVLPLNLQSSFAQDLPQRFPIPELEARHFPESMQAFERDVGGGAEVAVPFVFPKVAASWPVMSQSPESLKENFGHFPVDALVRWGKDLNIVTNPRQRILFSDFITKMVQSSHEASYVISYLNSDTSQYGFCDHDDAIKVALGQEQFVDDLVIALPKCIGRHLVEGTHFPSFHSSSISYAYFIGGATRTPTHQHEAVFLLQVYGVKKVFLVSPHFEEAVGCDEIVPPFNTCASHIDLENPDVKTQPKIKGAQIFQTVLNPGDILFIPNRWFHFVTGPSEHGSISITAGFKP